MAAKIDYQPNDICVLRISGISKRSEFAAKQSALACKIDVGAKPRLLAILSNLARRRDCKDCHRGRATLGGAGAAFAGTGVRRTPVKFFPPEEVATARAWLAE